MKSSNHVVTIAGIDVKPGRRRMIDIPVARLYTHTEMTMPVQVVCGKRKGHRLFVSAAVHGDEILGVEIVRRLLKAKALKRLSGALIAVPVVNVYGFVHQSRYLPDRRDLNRFFPGSEKGSLTSSLADIFMNEIVANSTHGIDLHTASNHRQNLPHIRAWLDDPETERLAIAFGAPVILDANLRDGSLRQAVMEKGVPMLVYEGGEALRFDEVAIKAGVRGILAVMRALGMLPKRSVRKPPIQPAVARSSTWVRAPASGILHSNVRLGARISEGTKLGDIADPFGEEESEVISRETGVVIGRLNLPLVHKGDALFHVACFKRPTQVADTLEAFEVEIWKWGNHQG